MYNIFYSNNVHFNLYIIIVRPLRPIIHICVSDCMFSIHARTSVHAHVHFTHYTIILLYILSSKRRNA